jgi:hypothetical protein
MYFRGRRYCGGRRFQGGTLTTKQWVGKIYGRQFRGTSHCSPSGIVYHALETGARHRNDRCLIDMTMKRQNKRKSRSRRRNDEGTSPSRDDWSVPSGRSSTPYTRLTKDCAALTLRLRRQLSTRQIDVAKANPVAVHAIPTLKRTLIGNSAPRLAQRTAWSQ